MAVDEPSSVASTSAPVGESSTSFTAAPAADASTSTSTSTVPVVEAPPPPKSNPTDQEAYVDNLVVLFIGVTARVSLVRSSRLLSVSLSDPVFPSFSSSSKVSSTPKVTARSSSKQTDSLSSSISTPFLRSLTTLLDREPPTPSSDSSEQSATSNRTLSSRRCSSQFELPSTRLSTSGLRFLRPRDSLR